MNCRDEQVVRKHAKGRWQGEPCERSQWVAMTAFQSFRERTQKRSIRRNNVAINRSANIRASFAFNLGYGERAAVIYLLQKALEEEMMRDTANELNKTRRLLEEAKP